VRPFHAHVAARARVRGIDEELWFGNYSDTEAEKKAAESVAATVGRVVGAKPFPVAAQRLAEATRDPNCNLAQVVRILERDMALSARVLRLVNSVSFALRTPCTSVRHAASLVGTEKLNQLASTAAILDMVDSSSVHASRILEHSAVVGGLCRYLGVHLGLPQDELFTCGFLHDIGKLMLLEVEGKKYASLLEEVGDEYDAIHLYERDLFGFDHALLAGHVLSRWSIPDPVPKVVAWHHHVTRAYEQGPKCASLVNVLRLADLLSYSLTSDQDEAEVERVARSEPASYLDISAAQLAAVWDEMRSLHERSRALFRGEDPPEAMPAISLRPSARMGRPSVSRSLRATHPSLRPPATRGAVSSAPRSPGPATAGRMFGVVAPGPVTIKEAPEGPKQFPCVVCEGPSFANQCLACHGYVCPEHQQGPDDWCQLCRQEYVVEAQHWRLRPILTLIFGAGVGATIVGAFFSAASGRGVGSIGLLVGPLIGTGLAAGLVAILHRYAQRAWFLRTRPDRSAARGAGKAEGNGEDDVPDSGVRESARPEATAVSPSLPEPPGFGIGATGSTPTPTTARSDGGAGGGAPSYVPSMAPDVESYAPAAASAPQQTPSYAPSAPASSVGGTLPGGFFSDPPAAKHAAHAPTVAVLPIARVAGAAPQASWPPSLTPPSKEAEERGRTLRLLSEHGVEEPKDAEQASLPPRAVVAARTPSSPSISVRPLFGSSTRPISFPEWAERASSRPSEGARSVAPRAEPEPVVAPPPAPSGEAWRAVLQATGTADGW
jgi:HD-like signal output (HDOD) protein